MRLVSNVSRRLSLQLPYNHHEPEKDEFNNGLESLDETSLCEKDRMS